LTVEPAKESDESSKEPLTVDQSLVESEEEVSPVVQNRLRDAIRDKLKAEKKSRELIAKSQAISNTCQRGKKQKKYN